MKRILILIFLLVLFTNCKTLRYRFVENFDISQNIELINRIKNQKLFSLAGQLNGLFIEKGQSYQFELDYDISKDYFHLKFYTPIQKELVFDAEMVEGDSNYLFFQNNFFFV